MSDFRLENNVPEVYVGESRDFQLLCRVIDVYLKGCMDRAANMVYQLDIDNCNDSLLGPIAEMQGFLTNMIIPSNVMRNILKVFPWCIKRKGTAEAIRIATYAVMSTYKNLYHVEVSITNGITSDYGTYIVEVSLAGTDQYLKYVREVLRFLVPAGYELIIRNVSVANASVEDRHEVEDYVARISGISGVIMGGNSPLSFEVDENEGTSTTQGYYSRVGFAKIIRSRNTDELLSQTSKLGGDTSETDLMKDGKPVFIHKGMKVK